MSEKLTLVEMTKSIMNAMDSDDIDYIDDVEESLQVVQIIKDTHNKWMAQHDWPHLRIPTPLLSLSDSNYPSTLEIPDNIADIKKIRYDVRETVGAAKEYITLRYKDPNDFLDMTLSRNSTATEVDSLTVKGSTTPLLILKDRGPTYWTSFDEKYITCDAYLSTLDSTLMGDKSICYATVLPTFDDTDNDFVPNIPAKMFPTFLAECTTACFFYLKQMQNPLDSKRAFRGNNTLKNQDTIAHERRKKAGFGRR